MCDIVMPGQDAASVESYADRKLLVALLTLGASGNPVRYPGTVVSQLANVS